MFGRETDIGIASERLFKADANAVLIAAGDEGDAACGADRRVGVSLHETDPARGNAVDIGSAEVGASVARDVGVTEIVGEDEDDVRRPGRRSGAGDA